MDRGGYVMARSSCSILSICTACARKYVQPARLLRPLASVQTRGKKTYTKDKNILVRLKQDLPGYGRKGAIVPMIRGQMRNIYFPQRIADYITIDDRKQLRQKNTVVEKDVTFGFDFAEDGAEIKEIETRLVEQPGRHPGKRTTPVRVILGFLQPAQAHKALDDLLPAQIVFYRSPITVKTSTDPSPPSDATPQPVEDATVAAGPSKSVFPPRATAIYGSVSTGDVATAIKALVAASEVAGRIIIGEEDVQFLHAGPAQGSRKEDADRVKQLGDYDVQISIKGHHTGVVRMVKVLGEDEAFGIDIEKGKEAVDELAGSTPIKGATNSNVLKAEGRARQVQEAISSLRVDFEEIAHSGRIAQEAIVLTPAEEAEIAERGDMVPPISETQVIVEEEDRRNTPSTNRK